MLREPGQICWLPISALRDEPPGADREKTNAGENGGGARSTLSPELQRLFLPPILVEPIGGGQYRPVQGEELLRRYREAGAMQVAAVIQRADEADAQASQLLGELSRGELDCFAEAERYRALLDETGATLPSLALRLGMSQANLRRKLRLLELDSATRAVLREAGLGEAYAQLLLRLRAPDARARLARQTAEKGLTVSQLEELIDGMLRRLPVPMPHEGRLRPAIRDHRLYLNAIRDIVEQMQAAGLQARMETLQGARLTEVRITVPVLRRV